MDKDQGTASDEDVEGLANDEDGSWGDYPIDTVLIRSEPRTVHDVLRRISAGGYVMDPDFQRDFIWPQDKQSKLIESVLMRIPLPVFYLAENADGRMIVVDGLQRLSTFQRFANDELALHLPKQAELHKKRFTDLSPKLQNRIEDCMLTLYLIDSKIPPKALLDIFERVNSGVPLTRQQMRNCLYTGSSTRFLRAESQTDLFLEVTGGSLRWETMRDRELVNRFCAFQLLDVTSYRGMDAFLSSALTKMNTMSDPELGDLSRQFQNSLANNFYLFGRHAFRKHYPDQSNRSALNASLWDTMTTGLSMISLGRLKKIEKSLKTRYYEMLDDEDFVASISYGTNQVNRVQDRFSMMREMLSEVVG
jgi:hypothetical protein